MSGLISFIILGLVIMFCASVIGIIDIKNGIDEIVKMMHEELRDNRDDLK